MAKITSFVTEDVRFPTSEFLDGSDAMNPDPDYSAAYLTLHTDDGSTGSGFVFTIGRGNDVQVAAIQSLRDRFVGGNVEALLADMAGTARSLWHDSQLRWLGPEKGVMHMAIGAVINALWDLRAKRAGQPLWLHLSSLSPEELVSLVDFRHIRDALSEQQALEILRGAESGRAERAAELRQHGYPAYTTRPGWLGYSDEKLERLCREALELGFHQVKLKVGANKADDHRRLAIARSVVGSDFPLAVDANQFWDVPDAIAWAAEFARYDLNWIEEPTSPDDVLGHAAIQKAISPIRVATGEHCQNRVMFKQFLQADALRVMQIDATRVGGVGENIANLLLATKFGVPVCPHAGGVGLCEAVQHLSMFDFVAVSGTKEGRMIEHADHLHEHFVTPAVIKDGNYVTPTAPGASTDLKPESIETYRFRG